MAPDIQRKSRSFAVLALLLLAAWSGVASAQEACGSNLRKFCVNGNAEGACTCDGSILCNNYTSCDGRYCNPLNPSGPNGDATCCSIGWLNFTCTDAQYANQTCGEGCPPEQPPDACSPTTYGDPADAATGASVLFRDDAVLETPAGSWTWSRNYVSNRLAGIDASLPKPFGGAPTNASVALWAHGFFSVVKPGTNGWGVRLTSGVEVGFNSCTGTGCWATPSKANKGTKNRLQRTAAGFLLLSEAGERYVYESTWTPPSGTAPTHYFLTRIESRSGKTLASLTYQHPSAAGLTCPSNGAGGSAAVPYLYEVQTPGNETLRFNYASLVNASNARECVVRNVVRRRVTAGGQTLESSVVAYTYATDAGGVERPGLLARATYADGREEQYTYPSGALSMSISGMLVTTHQYTGGKVSRLTGPYEDLTPSKTTAACAAGSTCCGRAPQRQNIADALAPRGDGLTGAAGLTRRMDTLQITGVTNSARLYQDTDACTVTGACSAGTRRYEWACGTNTTPGVLLAEKDKRDAWKAFTWANTTLPDGSVRQEKRAEKRGASAMDGTGALEETRYGYTYGGGAQLPASEERDSVLGPAGTFTRKEFAYDADNRLRARYETGYTHAFDAATGAWTVTPRVRATFFFKRRTAEAVDDPHGRTLEEHGPCWVNSTTDVDCPASPGFLTTQYFYFADTVAWPQGGRLQRKGVSGPGLAAPLETAWRYEYDSSGPYDITWETDPNGVQKSTYLRHGQHVASGVIAQPGDPERKSEQGYDAAGHLTWTKHPQGNYEVRCYRKGTPGAACAGGTLDAKLQWRAKSGVQDGATFSEKVTYTYWPDGTLKEERFLDASGATRRVRTYAADAHQRRTREGWGEGSAAYAATRGYDASDNLSATGHAFNAPPAWCGVTGPDSQPAAGGACSGMQYDRANRLARVDEYPAGSTSGTRTCFTYDKHGNVASVEPGLSASAACPATPGAGALLYRYDDFGQLVSVESPAMGPASARGTTRFAYDASGKQVVKQTPAMAAAHVRDHLELTYDALGRQTALIHRNPLVTGGAETLFTQGHDASATLPPGCGTLTHTRGRLLWRDDSFGRTWYGYDGEGRVVREVRVRRGATQGCSVAGGAPSAYDNPSTSYTYSLNGNLTSITYPYGRTVTYGYGTGGLTDRVQTVQVGLFGAGGAQSPFTLLSQVAWEPYGALRGYRVHFTSTTSQASVEYLLGAAGSAPGTLPADASGMPASDGTGRTRALWVSSLAAGAGYVPGSGNGSMLRQVYTWQADQVVRSDSYLLGASAARTETYSYDKLLRLTGATGTLSTTGGPLASRSYTYDSRGNRTGEVGETQGWTLARANATHPDQVTARTSTQGGGWLSYRYAYDADGRVSSIHWPNSAQWESPLFSLSFNSGTWANGGAESVFRSASVGGASYSYYYDAQNRRRLKVYPSGAKDEYFYDTGHNLLVDVGNTAMYGTTAHPADEYVWLDGRPVALIRGQLDSTWQRQPDTTADCSRAGQSAACGAQALVTDSLGKPVLLLDPQSRVSGVGEYDPFGHVNRVAVAAETPHPYGTLTGAFGPVLNPPRLAGTQLQMRVLLDGFELASSMDVGCGEDFGSFAWADSVSLLDVAGDYFGTSNPGTSGRTWLGWVTPGASGVQLWLESIGDCSISGGQCDPETGICPVSRPTCVCTGTTPTWPRYQVGAAASAYEYRRFQTGAQPLWTPLRMPGQYHDAETDLFENWNRYYDPGTGRYLQPEPLLTGSAADPALALLAGSGDPMPRERALPAYTYAESNPVGRSDPTGLIHGPICGMFVDTESGTTRSNVNCADCAYMRTLTHGLCTLGEPQCACMRGATTTMCNLADPLGRTGPLACTKPPEEPRQPPPRDPRLPVACGQPPGMGLSPGRPPR